MDEFSDRQLRLAYWWTTHREGFKRAFVGVFIAVNVVFWSISLFLWGRFFWYEGQFWAAIDQLGGSGVNPNAFLAIPESRPIPPRIGPVRFLSLAGGREDRVVEVENLNTRWVATVTYQLGDRATPQRATILPGEKKLLIDFATPVPARVESLIDPIQSIEWKRVSTYETLARERWKLRIHEGEEYEASAPVFFPARGGQYELAVDRVEFTVTNESALTFANPSFIISLWNGDALFAVNRVTIEALKPQETRSVDVRWIIPIEPMSIPSLVRIQVDPDVDITDPQTFR